MDLLWLFLQIMSELNRNIILHAPFSQNSQDIIPNMILLVEVQSRRRRRIGKHCHTIKSKLEGMGISDIFTILTVISGIRQGLICCFWVFIFQKVSQTQIQPICHLCRFLHVCLDGKETMLI